MLVITTATGESSLVHRNLLRLVAIASLAATVLLTGLAPAALAKPPSWSITSAQLVPGGVTAGTDQGFQVTIRNQGPSNISKLYLVAAKDTKGNQLPDAATYLASSRKASDCVQQGAQLCDFGAVKAGQTIVVTVAYKVPFSTGDGTIVFELTTTGLVRGKNNSHGDAAHSAQTVRLLPAGSGDEAGAWITAQAFDVANGQQVGAGNPQATRAAGKGSLIPVSVRDGKDVQFTCPASVCTRQQFGEWSSVNVAGGATFDKPFEVRITVAKQALPKYLKTSRIVVYHVLDDGTVETIGQCGCGSAKSGPAGKSGKGSGECVSVSTDAKGNLVLKLTVFRNGGYKGAF